MVNFPGRNGRRRRVLNDEVLSASGSHASRRAAADDCDNQQAPRYSDAAAVENHPQITDFVPRRYGTIVLLLLVGLATAVGVGGLHHIAPTLAQAIGMPDVGPFELATPGSLAAWLSAIVLALASATCLLVYSIRRHRIDDFRGGYRIWLTAAAACLLLSANSVAGLHQVVAYSLGHLTGWTALRGGAAWWLLLMGLPLASIAFRAILDVKECRLAWTLLAAAVACYLGAGASYLGFAPAFEARVETMICGVSLVLGHWLLLTAVVAYARFVVLDAQGLIPVRRLNVKPNVDKAKSGRESDATPATVSLLSAGGYTRQKQPQIQPAQSPASPKAWVDGSRAERDPYDDDGDDDPPGASKLSKAERKRLRKLKAQNRAA